MLHWGVSIALAILVTIGISHFLAFWAGWALRARKSRQRWVARQRI
jgi:hypothetical protein